MQERVKSGEKLFSTFGETVAQDLSALLAVQVSPLLGIGGKFLCSAGETMNKEAVTLVSDEKTHLYNM